MKPANAALTFATAAVAAVAMASVSSTARAEDLTLSDAELIAALDLRQPGLAAVKKAADSGDRDGAKRALAAYFRTRTSVPWTISPSRFDKQKAEEAVAGKVQVVTIWHQFPDGDIDWRFDATGGTSGLPKNNEWTWQLNRMAFWNDLGNAYQATGDEKYARAFVRQLRKWTTQCPPPTDGVKNGPLSAWRTIECGIRMGGTWPRVYHQFLKSPAFTDDDVLTFVKTAVSHARYLNAHFTGGNWLTMEMAGLYSVGALFPEFKDARTWRDAAAAKLHAELATQFLPDGAQIELSPGYHIVALDNALKIYEIARMVGREKELPADYAARSERAFDYQLNLMTPDRDLPRFNDSWSVAFVRQMEKAASLFPNRADFRWAATGGKAGTPPAHTSIALPWAGFFVMRSGWEPGATYGVLDAGPLGYGHVHQDKLNLVVWAYGRELLYDSGGGSYEQSKWRSYATDTFGHNCVLVDGKPQRRQTKDRAANIAKAPTDARWKTDAARDYAEGVYDDGWGTEDARIARQNRRVLFVKGDTPFFIVSDKMTPTDGAEHTYQARWHLLTTATALDPASKTVATTDAGKANLAVVPLFTEGLTVRAASAQTEPELLGWNVRKDLDPQYVPASTVLHDRKGSGPQRFLTLLLPLKPGQSNPVRSARSTADGAEITLADGRRWRITDSDAELSAQPVSGDRR